MPETLLIFFCFFSLQLMGFLDDVISVGLFAGKIVATAVAGDGWNRRPFDWCWHVGWW